MIVSIIHGIAALGLTILNLWALCLILPEPYGFVAIVATILIAVTKSSKRGE
ncbi:hypothetical protein FACS1894184_10110 [Clostridia bacterium]|nr:hypothetical protein FACS1894184_10110 [Clostridia bacterium]